MYRLIFFLFLASSASAQEIKVIHLYQWLTEQKLSMVNRVVTGVNEPDHSFIRLSEKDDERKWK